MDYFHQARNAVLFILSFCASLLVTTQPIHASNASEPQAKLNGGYYLLHKLSDDESQLPLLLVVKHAPPGIPDFARHISRTGKETIAALEQFQDQDNAIQFDKNPLPAIEQDVRDSIKDDKQHQLLFGTSNSEFVRALIVSQIEATTYATHLCKVLADQETDSGRTEKLRHLSAKWLALRNEAYRILRDY